MNKAAAEKAATESLSVATNPKYRALIMQVDVTKEDAVNTMIDETIKEFGRIDYALNSAGVSSLRQFKAQKTDTVVTTDWRASSSRNRRGIDFRVSEFPGCECLWHVSGHACRVGCNEEAGLEACEWEECEERRE